MKTGKLKTVGLDLLFILMGSAVYAVGVNAFTAPNNIAAGGVTGVATMLHYVFSTPIGLVAFLINVPIVLWAIVDIGYKLVTKTMLAILLSSVLIDLFSHFVPAYRGDHILVSLFAGVCEGLGLSLVFIRGERPVMDDKYELMRHPNISLTEDGGAPPYLHSPHCMYDMRRLLSEIRTEE